MSKLTLFLLGQPRIERDGVAVTVDTRKAIALLAYVAVTHQSHSRDALAALLWPEYDHVRAFANLRRTVWALNKALSGDYLHVDRDTIGLNSDADLWLDIDRFNGLIAAYQAHGHVENEVCAECLELLTEAVELYRADFLHGFALNDSPGFDDWQFFQSESLQRNFALALERLVRGYSARGEYEAAIPYARRWLALDVLHEPAHRALMELYAWSGQQSAALRQYRECVRALEEDLGVAPQDATVQLFQAIKAKQVHPAQLPQPVSQPVAVAPEPRPPGPNGSAPSAPPPAAARSTNLPVQSDPFVGRVEELREISTLLGNPDCRLLTLVGPGGIGKTRLAIQAASEQIESFAHGVYFVPCTAVNSVTSVVSAIADALHFSFYPAGEPQQQLLDFMRPKNLLLVIDSAEHLSVAVDLLTEILVAAPAVKVLVTSIERLNLREEWTLEVQGLRFLEHEKEAEVERYSAFQLFIQSARRTRAGYVPTSDEKPCIMRICRLVAGMPLGIELAASWMRVLSCQEIVREVEHNLDFLATSLRNVPERHRSMRAVFEHSWSLLSESEQHALGRLAIFQEGFRREAAEQIVGARLPLLLGLVDKSLLRRNTSGRYEMLNVIRQYAEAKLSAAAREETQVAHCTYYAKFLDLHGEAIKSGRQGALAEIRQELENIRQGWVTTVDHHRPHELRIFTSNLYPFFEQQGRFQEGEELFRAISERLEAQFGRRKLPDLAGAVLSSQIQVRRGVFCYRLGRNELAAQLLQEALAVFRSSDTLGEVAFCLTFLGDLARVKGQYAEARAMLEESLAICEQIGDRRTAARVYTNLGVVVAASGEYVEARRLFQESLAIFQALGDQSGEARVLPNLGIIAYYLHEYAEAERLQRASLEATRSIDNLYGSALALNNLGILAYDQGQYVESKHLHQESCTLFDQIGYRLGVGHNLSDLGRVSRELGEDAESRTYFYAALRTAIEIQAIPLALEVLVGIASLLKDGEPDRALDMLAIVSQHVASDKETRDRAVQLLADLRSRYPEPATVSFDVNQAERKFEQVVQQLLSE